MGLMKNIAASGGGKGGFSFKLSQVDVNNLQAKLNQLNDDVQKKALSKALSAGGRVFLVEARRRERVSDRVQASIQGRVFTRRGIKGFIGGSVRTFPNPAWFEFGTLDQYTSSGKRHHPSYVVKRTKVVRGMDGWFTLKAGRVISKGIRPRPYIQPAFDSKYMVILDKMTDVLSKEILKHGR